MEHVWDKFGYVGVKCFTGYKDRMSDIKKELTRVGLIDKAIFHVDFPDVIRDIAKNHIPFSSIDRRESFPIGYSNYRIVKTAYCLGVHSVLVIEDDIRFLSDRNEIKMSIESLPNDFDLAMLDKNLEGCVNDLDKFIKNQASMNEHTRWVKFKRMFSTGCYAMSMNMMRRWISCYERGASGNDEDGLLSCDEYFNEGHLGSDMNLYAANPSIAIQAIRGLHYIENYWNYLEQSGTKISNYG